MLQRQPNSCDVDFKYGVELFISVFCQWFYRPFGCSMGNHSVQKSKFLIRFVGRRGNSTFVSGFVFKIDDVFINTQFSLKFI